MIVFDSKPTYEEWCEAMGCDPDDRERNEEYYYEFLGESGYWG